MISCLKADCDVILSSFQLESQLETIKDKQQNGHFDLVALYSESLSELSNYTGFTELLILFIYLRYFQNTPPFKDFFKVIICVPPLFYEFESWNQYRLAANYANSYSKIWLWFGLEQWFGVSKISKNLWLVDRLICTEHWFAIAGRNYKRSAERCLKELEFVTTNLHVQRLRVIEQDDQGTHGCQFFFQSRYKKRKGKKFKSISQCICTFIIFALIILWWSALPYTHYSLKWFWVKINAFTRLFFVCCRQIFEIWT